MGELIRYKCKERGCSKEVVVPRAVYELMLERGESLPERCEECRERHLKEIMEIKCPYFQVELESEDNFTTFDYYLSAYTSHGNRPRQPAKLEPDLSRMKIRITDEHIKQLYEKLERNQVVVLTSPTGTGKSIYTLYRLLQKPEDYSGDLLERLIHQGQIIQTQPLTAAVERIPNAVSRNLLGEPEVGPMQTLGLRHRGKEKYGPHNLGVVVTDGSLRNWIRDGHLGKYSLIMIDEAHKRTLNIDTLLLLLKYKLPLYPHLRVIISSATIDYNEFKETFAKEGISVGIFDLSQELKEETNYYLHYWREGRVEGCDCWLCRDAEKRERFWEKRKDPPQESQLPEAVADFVLEILKETEEGSILAFLPGEEMIEKAKRLVEERKKEVDPKGEIPVITIYRRLGEEEVVKRFEQKGKRRRVLITTDIAETSHTLDDLVYVIDSGYQKESQWDPETETSSLPVVRHSKAGCRQRYGRVGRNQKGYVYCLYKREDFEKFRDQTTPEVFRSPFDDVLLNLRAAGIAEDPISLLGKQDDILKKEVERCIGALKSGSFIDERGYITEEGLEIFHIPKSSREIALMNLADEQNCLMEVVTVLSLMQTDEGGIRTGENLYHPLDGLLIWDPRWTARTKLEVWKIHQALKAGCKDDLDFIIKLAVCFLKAEQKGKGKEWALWHMLNYDLLKKCLLGKTEKEGRTPPEREELLDIYRLKAKEEEVREVDPELLDRVRSVIAALFPERIIELEKRGDFLTYQWGKEDLRKVGVVSKHCVGDWKEGDKAIWMTAVKGELVLDGFPTTLPVASFMVRLPDGGRVTEKEILFLDQRFPVGSWVSIKQEGDKYFISELIQLPPAIKIDYRIRTDFEMLLNDFLRSSYLGRGETIHFCEEFIDDELKGMIKEAEAIWIDGRRSSKARIIEWRKVNGTLKAIVAPVDDLKLLAGVRGKKALRVKIEKVVRDPGDKRGWILARTEDGLEVPIEMGELSLSHLGYGLERIEGEWLELAIKDFEGAMRRPKLSNLDKIIEDLEGIRRSIIQSSGKGMLLQGYIEEIDKDRERIVVVVPRGSGVVHFFEVKASYKREIAGRELSCFRIGEKVTVSLKLRGEKEPWIYCPLLRHQVYSLPGGLRYEEETGRLIYSYCMREGQIQNWEAPKDLKESIVKLSWRYAFR
jgi:HrpA-like RNA helicase